MPIGAYFKGHGREVMSSLRKAHPRASEERITSMFYATAKKRKMEPKSHHTIATKKAR